MSKVSDESVRQKTGKSMEEWTAILKEAGLAKASHKNIAAWLEENWALDPWWCQEVTVQFEQISGRRITGQTAESGFQVGVSGTFPASASLLWKYLINDGALQRMVLEEDSAVSIEPEASGTGKSGIGWKVTVRKEGSHLRMKWKASGWEQPSILQIRLTDKGPSKSSITFHQEKLKGPKQRESMKKRWKEVISRMKTELDI
jgi:hypothetical protein